MLTNTSLIQSKPARFTPEKSYWLTSGMLSIMQNLSSVLLGFGTFYLLVRQLDKNSFGAWALFMSTTTILETIRNGLIQNALIKFLASSEKDEHPKIISASFAISGIMSALCIALTLIFGDFLANLWHFPGLAPLFYFSSITFLLSGILTQFQFIEQANLAFTGIFTTSFIRLFCLFAYVAGSFFLHFEVTLISLVYVQIIGVAIATYIGFLFVKKWLVLDFTFHKAWVNKMVGYGKYALGTSVSSMLFNSIDQMMLGAYLSPVAAGAYNIAMRITNLVEIPTGSMAAIVFPQSTKRIEQEGKSAAKYLYEKSVGTVMAILLPGLVLLYGFSGFIVDAIAGETYEDAVPILKVTILNCLLIPFGRQFGTIFNAMGRPKLTFRTVFVSALINIALNYILIGRFGVLGAAYATLIANMIGFVISQAILRKELNVNIFAVFGYAARFYPDFLRRYVS